MYKLGFNIDRRIGRTTTLYFVQSGEFVKIGLAEDIRKRMFTLQLGNPHPLALRGTRQVPKVLDRQVETLVHAELHEFAIGREWFRIDPKDAIRRSVPYVNRATRTVAKWMRHGVDVGTGREVTAAELAHMAEAQR